MRRLIAIAALVLLGTPGQATASTAVAAPGQAPYTVLVVSTVRSCTGTLIDPSHVLTSADCALDAKWEQPLAPKDFGVLAGTVAAGLLGPEAQNVAVSAVRVHPAYLSTGAANVAMLELAHPLTMTDAVGIVPTAHSGARLRAASTATGFGWGATSSPNPGDRAEHTWDMTLTRVDCVPGKAGYACATSAADPICSTDIGGPVVQPAMPATVVGVVAFHGPDTCGDVRDQTVFVDLATPGVAQWVAGDDTPDVMPSSEKSAVLSARPRRDGAITCTPPAWVGATTLRTQFQQVDGGRVLQEGRRRRYVPKPSDVGHELGCVSIATSPGGTAWVPARETVSIVGVRSGRYRVCFNADGERACRWWRPPPAN